MPSRTKHAKNTKKIPKHKLRGTKQLHIFSDFDNTMIPVSAGGKLILHYLFFDPHHEPWYRRVLRVLQLATPHLRRVNFEQYYRCLRRIPANERHKILMNIPVNTYWLRAVKILRLEHRAKTVGLTIISRNCVDVIHDWVMQNRNELKKHNIMIEGIIANRPLADKNVAFVRERADLRHIDYVGFGQLLEKQKTLFLDKHSIYVGDSDDEILKDFVHEFVRV